MSLAGTCARNCGRPIEAGHTCCAECRDAFSAKMRARTAERRASGRCIQCGAPAAGRRYCEAHRVASRERGRRHYRDSRTRPERVVASLLRAARGRARRAKREFSVAIDDLLPVPMCCPILGIDLEYAYRADSRGPRDNSPSIDRIDNARGYVRGNVRLVSYRANRLRSDASIEELRAVLADAEAAAARNSRAPH